ncbi:MAG TPA: archaeosortase/exosortase family protein, partial [Pyrinomonadaceae bacterium]
MPQAISPQRVWKPLVIAAAVAFAYYGVLARLGRFWWEDENYSHGLLIPFVIGYILWSERGRLARLEQRPRQAWGGAGAALALVALWAGTAGAVAFAYWGVLARLGRFWWTDENYSHGLLIPF